ncbi:glycosyltransferase family 2 protein [Candidatus Woesebacteria bacterium]|nr:glycosyltransferase family 2 protein [Candidatus Woesebacteria bacterium]
MSLDVSIVIVNHSGDQLTTACLDSLLAIQPIDGLIHVFVVDNGSPHNYELPKRFLKTKQLDITLLRSESNLGFTGGNNMGIHAAIERHNSDYVLLLNNDTLVEPSFLQKMILFADSNPAAGIISSKIYFAKGREFFSDSYARSEKGKVLWYAGGSIDWANLDCFHRGVDEIDRGQFAQQVESDFATGCCALIRREVLEKIGFLDKKYFLYYEDADWSQKAKAFGYRIGYCDAAVVWHINAGSSQGPGSLLQLYYQTRNRLFFFWRYGTTKVKTTVARLSFSLLLHGSKMQKFAVWHFITGKQGKQPLS